jgi:alkylhydroperoxidase family enzyme
MDIMSAVGRRSGELSDDEIHEINDFQSSDCFSELDKAVLQFTTEVTNTPVRVCDSNYEILRQNFSEKQLVELTSAIAWENYRARYDHAFGVESSGFHVTA